MSPSPTPNPGEPRNPRGADQSSGDPIRKVRGSASLRRIAAQAKAEEDLALLSRQASVSLANGNFGEALSVARRATEAIQSAFGAKDPRYAVALENEAKILLTLKRDDQARQRLLEASQILLESKEYFKRDAAKTLEHLARLDLQEGKLESASEYLGLVAKCREEYLRFLIASPPSEDKDELKMARVALAESLMTAGWIQLNAGRIPPGRRNLEQATAEYQQIYPERGGWYSARQMLRLADRIPGAPTAQAIARGYARELLEESRGTVDREWAKLTTNAIPARSPEIDRLHEFRVNIHATLGQLYVIESLEGMGSASTDERRRYLQKAQESIIDIFQSHYTSTSGASVSRQGGVVTAALITLGWIYTLQHKFDEGRAAFRRALQCCNNSTLSPQQLSNALSAIRGLVRVAIPRNQEVASRLPYQPLIGQPSLDRDQITAELQRHALHLKYLGDTNDIALVQAILSHALFNHVTEEKQS